ncbi:MAG: hypothetical protein ACI8VC_002820 [Candidatus Endobugula sp.]|jgi:hypothetical protein
MFFYRRDHKLLADTFNGKNHLPLFDFIVGIDAMQVFHPALIALIRAINKDVTRLSFRSRLAPLTDRVLFGGQRFCIVPLLLVSCAGPQVTAVGDGDAR